MSYLDLWEQDVWEDKPFTPFNDSKMAANFLGYTEGMMV